MSPRGARAPVLALLRSQPRRTFATPPIKDTTPPKPIEPSREQAMPVGLYYESILNNPQPIPERKPEKPPTTVNPSPQRGKKPKPPKTDTATKASSLASSPPVPNPSHDSGQEKVRVIFGSRLVGPAERADRLAAIKRKSRMVAGVLVPPRPEEPDNCCMSGCVNCVWDRFRDEIEEWSAAHQKAERRLRAQEAGVTAATTAESMDTRTINVGERELDHGAVSLDDGGGGGQAGDRDVGDIAGQGAGTKLNKNFWDDDLYRDIPVGIREFMKQEKRLKEKHMRDGTVGG